MVRPIPRMMNAPTGGSTESFSQVVNRPIASWIPTSVLLHHILKLHRMKALVGATSTQQVLMSADLGDRATIEHDDSVGPLDRRQPVSDHEGRAVFHQVA